MIKKSIKYVLIVLVSFVFFIVLMESLLRYTTLLDQTQSDAPSYIPDYLKDIDVNIVKDGFVDKAGFRSLYDTESLLDLLDREDGCKLVVLGDSFVWGDGLPVKETWPSKLQSMTKCKVFPFGKNGWSTLEYFGFYEKNLQDKKFDGLIVGVVDNDPHPRGAYLSYSYGRDVYVQKYKKEEIKAYLKETYPLLLDLKVTDYLISVVGGLIDKYTVVEGDFESQPIVAYGYLNWRRRLYEDDVYLKWLNVIDGFMKNTKHKTCFLLTPTSNDGESKEIFNKISTSFDERSLQYKNTMSELDRLLEYKPRTRSDWANMADGHPGVRQTELYAREAYELLGSCGLSIK